MKGVFGKDTNNKLQPQPTENKITVLDFPISNTVFSATTLGIV